MNITEQEINDSGKMMSVISHQLAKKRMIKMVDGYLKKKDHMTEGDFQMLANKVVDMALERNH
jgi:hypothetical protein